jgi:(S)-3,5-dihydroxyphenylglycine transaminase
VTGGRLLDGPAPAPDPGAALSFELGALHAAIGDPQMDSMRMLSETAMRFPAALSFSSGAPYDGTHDPATLPVYLDRYLRHLREGGVPEQRIRKLLFQYGPVNGFIREEVARNLRQDEGIDVPADAVMITSGCQEAMLVALRGLITGPQDVLLTVSPAYVGILGAARMLDVPLVGVPEGPDGLDPDTLAAAVADVRASGRRPVAVYLIPDFSNPSGTVVPLAARHRLLELAQRERLVVLEDNPYGLFARDGEQLPTMKSLDRHGSVLYLGSFAKTAFPGARLGYLVADQPVSGPGGSVRTLAEELSRAKSMFTVGTSSLSQAVVGGMLVEHDYDLRTATRATAAVYAERLDTTLAALAAHFPPERHAEHGVSWNTPRGGFFLTVEVPFVADLAAMERCARDFGVSWAPMSMFHVGGGGDRAMRLGFSNLAPDDIREGVARLARFISDTTPGRYGHDVPRE